MVVFSALYNAGLGAVFAGTSFVAHNVGCNPCLVAGSLTGASMAGSAALLANEQDFAGHSLGVVAPGFTCWFMTRRWLSLRHPFVPNGVLACASALGLTYNAYMLRESAVNEW